MLVPIESNFGRISYRFRDIDATACNSQKSKHILWKICNKVVTKYTNILDASLHYRVK